MTNFFMSLVLFLKPILFILAMTDILKCSPVINYDFVSFLMQKSGKKKRKKNCTENINLFKHRICCKRNTLIK